MYHVGHFRRGFLIFLTLCLIALNSGLSNVHNAQARSQDVVARHLFQPAADIPTETMEPTETEVPTETMEPTETEVPTETMEPTETEVPTETMVPTGTAIPTETVIVTETATAIATPTEVTAPVVEPPAPTPEPTIQTISMEVPDPVGGIWRTPEPEPDVVPMLSSSSRPGDTVIVNIAPYGKAVDWVLFDIPDPENGLPKFENDRQLAAFKVFLQTVPNVGGLYFTNPPTIRIETSVVVPILLEQKDEPKLTRGNMSLGDLMASGDEDEWLLITRKVMVIVAIVVVTSVAGGVYISSVGPFKGGPPAGMIELGGLAQTSPAAPLDPVIFRFFAAPGEEWYLPPLPPGMYTLTLETTDGERFKNTFTLTGDPTESLLYQPNIDGDWELTVVHNGTGITSLPSTGAITQEGQSTILFGLSVVALGVIAVAIRRKDWGSI